MQSPWWSRALSTWDHVRILQSLPHRLLHVQHRFDDVFSLSSSICSSHLFLYNYQLKTRPDRRLWPARRCSCFDERKCHPRLALFDIIKMLFLGEKMVVMMPIQDGLQVLIAVDFCSLYIYI
ncbi:hypothetical protein NC651_007500 [Populus alba x Populus x berolinensis]|nr:hypothetical protein NC651_007500 [Populus alba x Populus x berolinensis]